MEKPNTPKRKKDICLWLVDGNAKVKKYRLTYFKLSLFAGFFTLLGALLFVVAGDYTRVQVLRVKNYLLLQKLEYQKDTLQESNKKLEMELSEAKDLNSKVLAYEQDVKSKLFDLSKVIEGATSLDVLEEEANSDTAPAAEDGVGGAEVDISSWSDVGLRGRLDPSLITSPQQIAMIPSLNSKSSFLPQEGLPDKIDRYIKLIKELPLNHPAYGKITSGFGGRISPFTHHLSIHEGIDISLGSGTAIKCAGNGIVKTVDFNPTYGLMVDVEHNDRILTRYAHLNKVLVKENQVINAGDLVGLSGSTGRSTGPHLHYEVRLDGKAKNPKSFINLLNNLKKVI
jgi:murein DD-endopeptidase MepM/ murein hydrolase activator NlpD